ncbi:DUF3667 domain-containing protein [Paraburkholderia sp. DHOC27]|nr:DUF3667 domain-containing protein [Paraburkholderia sp. DHOC27]
MPTVREFLHEYLHHHVAAEGKLFATLKLLILRPGQLTVEFLVGRRQRYVKPLSLYLTLSFVFFLLLSWSGTLTPARMLRIDNQPVAHPAQTIAALAASETDPDARKVLNATASFTSQLFDPVRFAAFSEHLLQRLPYALFVLMPVFAAMCAWVYRSRRQTYGVHLLFTLHLHAFIFVLFLLCLLPGVRSYAGYALVLLFAYLVAALRRVHGGRWWPQFARSLLLAGAYAVICSVALSLVTLMSADVHVRLF